jgi:uncharacterized membrane protein
MKDIKIKKIVISSMMAAVITVATMIVRIPSPTGYVNLGDCFVLVAAWSLGPVYGVLAAAIGSALADLLAGYALYIIPTFVIKGLMALIAWALFKAMCKVIHKHELFPRMISAVVAELFMAAGYLTFEIFAYDATAAIQSVPGNLVQGLVGAVASILLITAAKRYKLLKF